MFFFDPVYIVLVVVMVAISGWAAWRVRSTYARWSKVDSGINLSAYDFARRLLDRQDLTNVQIEPTPGRADRPLRPPLQDPAGEPDGRAPSVPVAGRSCRSRPRR